MHKKNGQGSVATFNLLQSYVRNVMEAQGLVHKARLEGLRSYLKSIAIEDFKKMVVLMDDEKELKTLWEAGLDSWQQHFVLRRVEELKTRRTERRTI